MVQVPRTKALLPTLSAMGLTILPCASFKAVNSLLVLPVINGATSIWDGDSFTKRKASAA